MESATKKSAGTSKALKMSVAEREKILTTKLGAVVHSDFDDQLEHNPPVSYIEPSIKIDKKSCSWVNDGFAHLA